MSLIRVNLPKPANLRPLLVVFGFSLALVGCGGSPAAPRSARSITIQPIQVCNTAGTTCARLASFMDATAKIWAQANISVTFLPPNRLLDDRYLVIDNSTEFSEISFSGAPGAFGRNPLSTSTSGPINLWFVQGIFATEPGEVFGLAWVNQNGVLISDRVLDFNPPCGRIDTVGHEIGHNLGLTHTDYGSGASTNLMTTGSNRLVPCTPGDITPDGARLDRLTDQQIDVARSSSFVSDSPGSDYRPSTSPDALSLPYSDPDEDGVPFRFAARRPQLNAEQPDAPARVASEPQLPSLLPLAPVRSHPWNEAFPTLKEEPVSTLAFDAAPSPSVSPQSIPEAGFSNVSAGLLALLLWRWRRQ